MAREREVYVPVVIGVGSVGPIIGGFFAVVLFAVALCVAVSCTDFGATPAAHTLPSPGPCAPFCLTTPSTSAPGGAR
jgi:hypothetical protein